MQVDRSGSMGLFQKSLTGIKNFFLFRVPMNDWKAKLERPHIFKVQPGKIIVCVERSLVKPLYANSTVTSLIFFCKYMQWNGRNIVANV